MQERLEDISRHIYPQIWDNWCSACQCKLPSYMPGTRIWDERSCKCCNYVLCAQHVSELYHEGGVKLCEQCFSKSSTKSAKLLHAGDVFSRGWVAFVKAHVLKEYIVNNEDNHVFRDIASTMTLPSHIESFVDWKTAGMSVSEARSCLRKLRTWSTQHPTTTNVLFHQYVEDLRIFTMLPDHKSFIENYASLEQFYLWRSYTLFPRVHTPQPTLALQHSLLDECLEECPMFAKHHRFIKEYYDGDRRLIQVMLEHYKKALS